jgi:hypothetical protein
VLFVKKLIFLLKSRCVTLGFGLSHFTFGDPFIAHCYGGFCPTCGLDDSQIVVRYLCALEITASSGKARWTGYQISEKKSVLLRYYPETDFLNLYLARRQKILTFLPQPR